MNTATRRIKPQRAVDRRARRGARARGAALRAAVARPDRAAVRGAARGRRRRAALRRRSRPARRACTSACGSPGVGPGRRGDHVAVLVRRVGELRDLRGRDAGLRRHRPAHATTSTRRRSRPRSRRADEGDRRRRHLRLPGRVRRAARDLRPARARARRGRVRGARRPLQGPAARLARPAGGLRVLPQQADDDGRGRRGHDGLRGGARAARRRCATRAGSRRRAGSSTAASGSTTASTTSRRRSASASSRSSTGSSRARREVAARYGELLAGVDVETPLRGRRGSRAVVVRLRRQAPGGRRPRRACSARLAEDGIAGAPYLPVDPPPVVHARALRLRRGDAARSARTAARARWRSRSTRVSSAPTRSASPTACAPPSAEPRRRPPAEPDRPLGDGAVDAARGWGGESSPCSSRRARSGRPTPRRPPRSSSRTRGSTPPSCTTSATTGSPGACPGRSSTRTSRSRSSRRRSACGPRRGSRLAQPPRSPRSPSPFARSSSCPESSARRISTCGR